MSTGEIYSPGLEGVIAGETAISTITEGLSYRGYPVTELADQCAFDEVAFLLLHGELPKAKELANFKKRIAVARRLPEPLRDLLKALPKWTLPMDAIRTSVSILSHFDQDMADNSPETQGVPNLWHPRFDLPRINKQASHHPKYSRSRAS